MTTVVAQTSQNWPEAAIAIAGIALVTVITVAIVWQVFATWRARMSVAREGAYRALAEEAASAQTRTAEALETATGDLADIRRRTAEMERLLKEVE